MSPAWAKYWRAPICRTEYMISLPKLSVLRPQRSFVNTILRKIFPNVPSCSQEVKTHVDRGLIIKRRMGGPMLAAKHSYFQYVKDIQHPLFLRLNLDGFNQEKTQKFLEQHQFSKVNEEIFSALKEQYPSHYRLLTLKKASSRVAKHMGPFPSPSSWNSEDIILKKGYQLYRFQGHALMVYSPFYPEWELGVHGEFGTSQNQTVYRIILNRFLGLAGAPLGICGFWGAYGESGVVVMDKISSLGEAIFIDLKNDCVLTMEGPKPLGRKFGFIRLDASLRGGHRRMSGEELLGFLSSHCVFLDPKGLSLPVRQMVNNFSLHYQGWIYPPSHFTPQEKSMAL